MREMVDQIHEYMWAFCEKAQLDIDPVMLKRSIGQQVSGALLVIYPESLKRIGHARLAVMIDVANRYDLTLAEVLNEALIAGGRTTPPPYAETSRAAKRAPNGFVPAPA